MQRNTHISPAVFGSLFQGILDDKERRQHGAHYTSERDIMRVLRSLVTDDLRTEFESIKADRSTRRTANMEALHHRLRALTFLDPACGCGNFLVLAYREIRTLELEVLLELTGGGKQQMTDVRHLLRVDVDQFYGIERDEWPARIAEVALWLMDHQMNLIASERLGQYFERLPLVTSPRITIANALNITWDDILPRKELSFVIGNPPYVGKAQRSAEQQADMDRVWSGVSGTGVLDYVTCWYRRAAEYIEGTSARAAFVSTASISHGEQVGILWADLFKKGMKIQFAHRTFPWTSEARGKAHVHVVVIGFGSTISGDKRIYDYDVSGPNAGKDGAVSTAKNISPYLVEANDLYVLSRQEPLSTVRSMSFGNMPNDGGNLLLTEEQREGIVGMAPKSEQFIRPFVGPDEFMKGNKRYCLWLNGADPGQVRRITPIMKRVEAVRENREKSTRPATRMLATKPMLFGEIRQPTVRYLGIPKTGSERRRYVPMGFFEPTVIAATDLFTIEGAGYYEFGILSSALHMAWVKTVAGRFKSDPRYSAGLAYNPFPWPAADKRQRADVEACAKAVEEARVPFLPPNSDNTMSDLYDPLTMPATLAAAHVKLDRAVDRIYRDKAFQNDRQRVEHLMAMYEQLAAAPKIKRSAKPVKARPSPEATPAEVAALPKKTRKSGRTSR